MGYLNDTDMSQFIPPSLIVKTAGTWTDALGSSIYTCTRTAAAATFNLIIPVLVMANIQAAQGIRLKSIDVYYKIATASLNGMATVALSKNTGKVHGSALVGSGVTVSMDSSHGSSANRSSQASHKMTVTLASPMWVLRDELYVLYITCDAAAGTVFTLYGAQANFELRL